MAHLGKEMNFPLAYIVIYYIHYAIYIYFTIFQIYFVYQKALITTLNISFWIQNNFFEFTSYTHIQKVLSNIQN